MADAIKRDDADKLFGKLKECHSSLKKGNMYSCLVAFRGVLEKMNSTRMIPADDKALKAGINSFQQELASSSLFRDTYGPVTFRDNEIAPALALMQQLIEVKEEEIKELVAKENDGQALPDESSNKEDDINSEISRIKLFIERGDYATAQEMIAGREDLLALLVNHYNDSGMKYRRECRYDEALGAFNKIINVCPPDEGLHYNLARVHICKKEWKAAEEAIQSSLKINPEFEEGIKLLGYVREAGKAGW